ncbi:15-hydroxyprostaglandin dehydrogenase [NAD(+)] [Aspergillus udagawae]|uniref:15-hydroxyprostaglandin dehydrogenase [NAD(+)] n=1 Tax=Aspergillus udagawae TaxID=91492 RepID=A0ABQ1ATZ6_9EURO|nr:15-hydroxyprostaglandin dehydrogenase [NAD(+)] [Aspergillus udagawae]GFF58222.1 15-hydroxyprostaglandin dehydrogenase [NAD(+)] [Aspergillus udagawae]GFF88033.1 15-hydroxyprostaglandin dehydrogenase [NAD(+)] [Aspergillus udagawae]GFG10276.1 15-hydroxyprostaglandin dehydrogenase [NAD(+)] [Aspergillus udagawae]
MPPYVYTGPVDCSKDVDCSALAGKTAIVTGGANGLGEAYVRALVAAGVYVCIGDINTEKGQKLEAELPGTKFVPCSTGTWTDQVRLFEAAATFSPTNRIHYVIANAGIHRRDEIFQPGPQTNPLTEPDLSIIDINIKGPLYTAKLAMHYFIRQNGTTPTPEQEDTCLILIGSGAAFLDVPRSPQYSASKWAMRGIMHSLRRTAYYYGSRVNVISPWYVRTGILSEEVFAHVERSGVEFATADDAGRCLLRILADEKVNGHSFFVTARKWADKGFVDLDLEDYKGDALLGEVQEMQMRSAPVKAGLFA